MSDSKSQRTFPLLQSLQGYKLQYLPADIMAGLVIAALTIPVSMGYAQVAGLPSVYGLYGSILPCIAYALFSSSPQVVFGLDAAASAITGSIVAAAGIAFGSDEALVMIPALAFFTGCILVLFGVLRAGRLIGYISKPVMGGFVTGLAISVIMTQIPKLLGVKVPSSEDLFENIQNIVLALPQTNLTALVMGCAALAILLLGKRFIPRVPMSLIVLVASVAITQQLHLEDQGVMILGAIDAGLPPLMLPNLTFEKVGTTIGYAFTIAVVVTAESTLAGNTFASRNHYRINNNRELIAFGMANFAASFVGTVPASASVSRTAASDTAGGKSQLSSIFAAGFIALVCLFLSPYLYYLPTPVLGAIVTAALVGLVETRVAVRLAKHHPFEFAVFIAAALGVLVVGVVFGVMVGVVLSFVVLLVQDGNPVRGTLGVLPGKQEYHLQRNQPKAQSIEGVLLYDFNAGLSFANVHAFVNDIEAELQPETKLVVVDASGINYVDSTALDSLAELADQLDKRGIDYYAVIPGPFENQQRAGSELEGVISAEHFRQSIADTLAEHHIDPYPDVTWEAYLTSLKGSLVQPTESAKA